MGKEIILLKFGGSLITDKRSNEPKINHTNINSIGKKLIAKNYDIIIVHGAGSFGHPIAKKFGILNGKDDTREQSDAIKETRKQVQKLNKIFCKSLNDNNLKTQPIIPSKTMKTKSGKIVDFPINLFDKALNQGEIPVTFGDVTDDLLKGVDILSGDTLMLELANYYKPKYSIFIMDYPGVFNGDPANSDSKIYPLVDSDIVKKLEEQSHTSQSIDVTGGLIGKIECALKMSKTSDTWITNLEGLSGFFNGKTNGSRVLI
tara:strand:- start:1408 stop:2187 length:780 start_codon:yes stop_codon:yes gene_type:complete